MATLKEQNGFYVISGSTSKEALTTTLNIEAANRASNEGVGNYVFPVTGQSVRVVMHEGKPWFVAKDVCNVLEIENVGNVLAALDADEKITIHNADSNPRAGIPHKMVHVNESGLYSLVFRSRKPEAQRFRKWVTSEVLPALRQHGHYGNQPAPASTAPAPFDAWAIIEHVDQRFEDFAADLASHYEPIKARVAEYDALMLGADDTLSFTEAGQAVGMSAKALGVFLRRIRWIQKPRYMKGNPHRPLKPALQAGYFVEKRVCNSRDGFACNQTRITLKGLNALAGIIADIRHQEEDIQ